MLIAGQSGDQLLTKPEQLDGSATSATAQNKRPASRLHVPQPPHRENGETSFGNPKLSPAGATRKPDVASKAVDLRDMAFELVRVLDDDGKALGPWNPGLSPDQLREGLRKMLLLRVFDDRMHKGQRQGKTSFYMQATGEEAITVAQTMALRRDDMCFPTYRCQGILITRDYPLVDMMNQIYSNAKDPLKGHQLPILYSARDYGFFSASGNVGTQICQSVGWAMGCAYRGTDSIAAGWIGEGSTAEGDFHNALVFASVYRAPVILNVVNNQWAISSNKCFSGVGDSTFASRAIGFDMPGIKVDANDFLATYAVTQWAAERARKGLGATLIELYTYRAGAHSTSDDPTRYRPAKEVWPLGDPVDRLTKHLKAMGEWSDERNAALIEELTAQVRTAQKESEAIGTLGQSKPSVSVMFDDVYKEPDWRLRQQRQSLGV